LIRVADAQEKIIYRRAETGGIIERVISNEGGRTSAGPADTHMEPGLVGRDRGIINLGKSHGIVKLKLACNRTGYRGVVDHVRQEGIVRASGAVGLAAVQLGKAMGATVLAGIARMEKAPEVRHAGADAVIDLSRADLRDSLRAEVSAIGQLLIARGVVTAEGYTAKVHEEAEHLCKAYERRFPGFKATDYGLDINTEIARDTTAGWKP